MTSFLRCHNFIIIIIVVFDFVVDFVSELYIKVGCMFLGFNLQILHSNPTHIVYINYSELELVIIRYSQPNPAYRTIEH